MKRFLCCCICMLGLALPVAAQQLEAKEILDRTAENFRKAGGVKAAFTVRTSGESSTGVICLKGDKFLLEADGVVTWFDGRTQWSYLASSDEVNVSEPSSEELQNLNPYTLLYMYKQGYKLKIGRTDSERNKSVYEVVMTATDRKQDLQCIILYVDKETFRPRKISMAERGGKSVAVITINTYQTDQTYPDSFFVFDKKAYPTAEVIDLR